ncbi:MAG: response regulator transcription factor [Burkholderiales bacterium]|nr:response regulator transcription factor [Burkholderiales bacterium]
MRVLLAEDDAMLGRATCLGLMQSGYAVDWVTSAEQGLAALDTQNYDCVLLDLGLPGMSGEECLRVMRTQARYTPVIIITARGHVEDRIQLLDEGADDYLVKPFDLDEVAARVRAVVRRAQVGDVGEEDVVHGPLTLQPASRSVLWNGRHVALTTKEFWVLELLMRRRSRTVSRQQIEEALYGWGEEIESNAVQVHIHHLRRKLDPRLIITTRGMGYQLAPAQMLNSDPGVQAGGEAA